MNRTVRAAALALAASLLGCEALQGFTENEFAIVALLQTPELVDPTAPDKKIPAKTLIEAFFGHAKVTDPSQPQNPDKNQITFIDDAKLTVSFTPPGGQAILLDVPNTVKAGRSDSVPGRYALDSEIADTLAFHPGVKYTFEFQYSGAIHRAAVTPPPPVKIKEFNDPNPRIRGTEKNHAFTITREGRDLAVWIVMPVKETGSDIKDATTNLPRDAPGLLKLVFDDSAFTSESFEIPGTAFPDSGPYGVVLGNMRIGEGFAKLAPISGVLAASADFGILWAWEQTAYSQVQPLWGKCTSCHSAAGAATAGGLNLASGSSHAALVGVTATDSKAGGLQRVKAGDIYNSYLLHKLVGTAPPGGTATGTIHPALPDVPLTIAEMKTVVHWVMEGAPSN
jgi:hypothetical protein